MPLRLSQKYASLGAFGGDLIVEFVPDPDELATAILQVADELDNTIVPLEASKVVAREDMKKHFDEESAPDGTEWQALDDEYAAYKDRGGFPPDILRRSGAMEDRATSEAAWEVNMHTVEFNTAILPTDEKGRPYWYFHQVGTGEGEFVGKAKEFREQTIFNLSQGMEAGGVHESFGIGSGKALPARPFIGLSEDAELSIIEIFDKWFDESVSAWQTSRGNIQTRTRSGQFGFKLGSNE